jgi:hypothetical protein
MIVGNDISELGLLTTKEDDMILKQCKTEGSDWQKFGGQQEKYKDGL